jgi:hypothetical protein
VAASSSLFPVPITYSLSTLFCHLVRKIELSCQDQTKITLELAYPNICTDVAIVLSSQACNTKYKPNLIKQWNNNKTTEFSNLILKYTQENIVLVNIYIKDPFEVKYRIEENASR